MQHICKHTCSQYLSIYNAGTWQDIWTRMTNQNTVYQLLFETTLFCDLFVMDQFAATNFHDQDKNTVHGTLMVWCGEKYSRWSGSSDLHEKFLLASTSWFTVEGTFSRQLSIFVQSCLAPWPRINSKQQLKTFKVSTNPDISVTRRIPVILASKTWISIPFKVKIPQTLATLLLTNFGIQLSINKTNQ